MRVGAIEESRWRPVHFRAGQVNPRGSSVEESLAAAVGEDEIAAPGESQQQTVQDFLAEFQPYLAFIHYLGFGFAHNCNTKWATWKRALANSCKLAAMGFAGFLTGNHSLVLVDYILNTDMPLLQLMLEARLVITKLSAFVFVLTCHLRRHKIRELVAEECQLSGRLMQHQSSPALTTNRRSLRWRIRKWWLMCASITALHFGLSEAEVSKSHHLWIWLDDYSMHQLNNRTTTLSQLMFLASFDNYMYTVHVYGARLFGASVLCLVFGLQADSIAHLRRQALKLARATESRLAGGKRVAASGGKTGGASGLFGLGDTPPPSPTPPDDGLIRAQAVGQQSLSAASLTPTLATNGATTQVRGATNSHHQTTANCTTGPTPNNSTSPWLVLTDCVPPPPPPDSSQEELGATPDWFIRELPISGHTTQEIDHMQEEPLRAQWLAVVRAAHVNRQLERLVEKYELVRSLNERLDACFGPILLLQYSALFLMSCIDVVYFSIAFSPSTKTKYIIVSGMVLLWWPYLLLYKYASDIAAQSSQLLKSVQRLARLALLDYHQSLANAVPVSSTGLSSFGQLNKQPASAARAATMLGKLEHVFKPTHISLVGVIKIDKVFLFNFAKIVITASVMIIQFVS